MYKSFWRKNENRQIVDIQEHCFKLRELLGQLDPFEYILPSDWLNIAAGVESVTVTTSKYDESVMYCRGAFEYEEKRSQLLSHLTTKLTIFNFVWGSFESIVETLELPKLPGHLRQVGDSPAIRTLWFLKQNYGSGESIVFYNEELEFLKKLEQKYGFYNDNRKNPKKTQKTKNKKKVHYIDYADINGLGLDIVRRSRNALAHGSASMPIPDDWGEGKTQLSATEQYHIEFINTSTRIILLTIQMLLFAYLQGKGVIVECLLDKDGFPKETTVEDALMEIHLEIEE